MLTQTSLPEQASLLLLQREQMSHSRYVGLQQLQQHDRRLLAHLHFLRQNQNRFDAAENPWLCWLMQVEENLPALLQAELSSCFRAYLWQLKAHFQQFSATSSLVQLLNHEPDAKAAWLLAQHCPEHFQHSLEQLPLPLQQNYFLPILPTQNSEQAPSTDWSVHLEPLSAQQPCSLQQLSILMMQANVQQKQAIINLLSMKQDRSLAILAMALSGQFKYLPVLVDLAQEQAWSETVADSLTIMLGVLAADAVLADGLAASDPVYLQQAFRNSGAVWAQEQAAAEQLGRLWQHGNQLQRQLAAIKAAVQWPKVAVLNCASLWGGAWHTAFA